MGLVETRRGPTISVSLAMISSRESIRQTIDNGEWIIESFKSARFQLSIINFLQLQMAAARDQDVTAGEHTSFIARQKRDRASDVFGIEMLFQRPRFFDPLAICFRHDHRRIGERESWGDDVDRDS